MKQEELFKMIETIDPEKLENRPDVYALGKLIGKINIISDIDYELTRDELSIFEKEYNYLSTADTLPYTIYSKRLELQIAVQDRSDTKSFTVDGIRFDMEKCGKGYICYDIQVEDEVPFESYAYFWFNWLEEIFTALPNIDGSSIKYILFSGSYAEKILID